MPSALPANRSHRARRPRWLRVALLALALVLANTLAPWSMHRAQAHAPASTHPCHPASHDHTPAPAGTCPCCDDGACQCLHGSATLPGFLIVEPLAPVTTLVPQVWTVPPAPPVAEQLRPPIA